MEHSFDATISALDVETLALDVETLALDVKTSVSGAAMWHTGCVATRWWTSKKCYDQNLYSG